MIRLGKWVNALVIMGLTNLFMLRIWLQMSLFAYGAAYALLLLAYLWFNAAPLWKKGNFTRLGVMLGGAVLLETGVVTFTLNLALTLYYGFHLPEIPLPASTFFVYLFSWLLYTVIVITNGFLRMYATSLQLGIKWRVVFFLLWWFPLVNLVLLWKVCRIVREEYAVETEKQEQNAIRRINESCKTRYPLVLVHGVFFRDRKYFNYWGRIPGELFRNGATVYYGGQQSAAGTEDAAGELKERILQIIRETGCGKVNILAHSKGGLEARCAISRLGLAPYVASLTTINTPHRGCAFADWLLKRIPQEVCGWVARRYNGALRKLGDSHPDFLSAVWDLTAERCEVYNRITPDAPGVLYQSVGSRMRGWTSAPFPLNLTYFLVRRFDRENDGLVGVDSMKWGATFRFLTAPGRRGISHGDMIDLNRQNIRGFDVREFYVELVRELRERGY